MNADDFGQSPENNAGVIRAYQAGSIHAASLMIAAEGSAEAVALARQHPGLKVGLHICLSEGKPALEPSLVPDLVEDGVFPPGERKLFRAAVTRAGCKQIAAEVKRQFELFAATDLRFDHVNVHRNSHRHPVIAHLVFGCAARYGVQRVRIAYDPLIGRPYRLLDPLRFARTQMMRTIARYHGREWMDYAMARNWTNTADLVRLIDQLAGSRTELYFHPVLTEDHHMFSADLPILLDIRVKNALGSADCAVIPLTLDLGYGR